MAQKSWGAGYRSRRWITWPIWWRLNPLQENGMVKFIIILPAWRIAMTKTPFLIYIYMTDIYIYAYMIYILQHMYINKQVKNTIK